MDSRRPAIRSKYLRRLVAVDNPQAAQTLAKKPREDAQAYYHNDDRR